MTDLDLDLHDLACDAAEAAAKIVWDAAYAKAEAALAADDDAWMMPDDVDADAVEEAADAAYETAYAKALADFRARLVQPETEYAQ